MCLGGYTQTSYIQFVPLKGARAAGPCVVLSDFIGKQKFGRFFTFGNGQAVLCEQINDTLFCQIKCRRNLV